ncbi:hypothetical protein ACFOHS_19615 [Jhaorihella thermophila]
MPSYDVIKARQRAIRDQFPEDFGLRIHRAISWLGRAEREQGRPRRGLSVLLDRLQRGLCGRTRSAGRKGRLSRLSATAFRYRSRRADLQRGLAAFFSGPIRLFLENRHVFGPWWHFQNGLEGYEN